ncbi:MAG TPA: hypothetical protein VFZ00_00200 [Solirubrobacter sp.]|nr:hypothetical protein [Solirubrobacter sp.]
MEIGSLARKALTWAIVALVAIVLFSIVLSAVVGFVKLLMTIALLALVVYAAVWVLRKL